MNNLCFGCMKDTGGMAVCPHCGYDMNNAEQTAPYLPLGILLQERYIVGKRLYNNGESAKYLCYDKIAQTPVIVKEFLPAGISGRAVGKVPLVIKEGCDALFHKKQQEFLEYYRAVGRMRELVSLVPIYDIFSENNTSYVVSESVENITFREYIQRSGGKIDWNTARPLFMPLLSALSTLSQAGIYHLGISPDNLIVTPDGKLKLVNFAINDLRTNRGVFEPEYFMGTSAPEQYKQNAAISSKADIYGFNATLFYALTGSLPESADKRKADGKLMISNSVLRKLPPHVVNALANGLQISVVKRTESFELLRSQLTAAPTVQAMQREAAVSNINRKSKIKSSSAKRDLLPGFVWVLVSCAVSLFLFVMVGMMVVDHIDLSKWFKPAASTNVDNDNPDLNSGNDTEKPLEEDEFLVPDLAKMTYQEAVSLSASTGGQYTIVVSNTEQFSSDVKEGCVISQSPEANSVAKDGVTVCVVLSKGTEKRELPSVSGKTVEKAVESLNKLGFITCVSEEYNEMVTEGKVIRYKEYTSGDSVTYGSKIEIVVSKGVDPGVTGIEYVTLTDIKDEDFNTVQSDLIDKGLRVTAIRSYSNEVEAGKCIGYDGNKKGDKVEEGSSVVIIVSRGPLP